MRSEHENGEISNIGSPNRGVNNAPTVSTQDDVFYQRLPKSQNLEFQKCRTTPKDFSIISLRGGGHRYPDIGRTFWGS